MNGFCVECGIDTDKLIRGMCIDCFLRDRMLMSLPDHVDLFVCTSCGQYLRHGEWQSMARNKAITHAAREAATCIKEGRIKGTNSTINPLDDYNISVTLDCNIEIEDFETPAAAATIVRIKNTVCKICSRRSGNYYEAILQIRTAEKSLSAKLQDEVLERVEKFVDDAATTNVNAFITKMEIVPGGVDVYLSLIALGRELTKALGDQYCAETDESSKLVGQTRDGIDMYRVSYLVRLPDFHIGDVVRYGKKYYRLTRVSSTGGKLKSLNNFSEMPIRRVNMPDMKVHTRSDEMEIADVISISDGEIQIMDPNNYNTVDLLVPKGAEIGETVRIVRIDGVIYYVP
ncbi:MAG: hypothetical protein MJZ68_01380 [archaeon]|nr:hypothetical protein [archaeon]